MFFLARAFLSFSSGRAFLSYSHRPLSFSCPPLSCTVPGDCLSKQVVLRGAVFSFFKACRRVSACHTSNIARQSIVSCLYPKYSHLVNYNDAVHLLWAGATAGLYCTVGYAFIVSPSTRCQSSLFLSFVLGAVECLCGRRKIIRLLMLSLLEKVSSIAESSSG